LVIRNRNDGERCPAQDGLGLSDFFASGIAGLGYEIAWTRMFAIGLGHEIPSLVAVVAAFFGGFSLGAWALDGLVSRARRPGRCYAALELLIGAWALASLAIIPSLNDATFDLIGLNPSPIRHWVVAFLIPFVGLLPATAAMGATFPAMERFVSRLRQTGATVGGLYAVNTIGAVAGVCLGTFLIIPAFGYRVAVVMMATLNLACAAAITQGPARDEQERPPVNHVPRTCRADFALV
jgi:spermidine synthase